jgi:predicted AlkP superfamily pyrophosphatase or phosphodiesterase
MELQQWLVSVPVPYIAKTFMRIPTTTCSMLACLFIHSPVFAVPLLLISIDGLHPAYVTEADRHGLKIPNLRGFMTEGTYAQGVVGVVPTVTYPSHTTLVTGVAPAAHGIVANTPFDPLGANRDGWYWYVEDLRAPTLWQAAAQAKLATASVNWPVTVGDKHIQYLIPEFWRSSTPDDLKLMRALSRPEGLLAALEAKLGPFVDGYIDTVESDVIRTRFTVALLKERHPDFMATHLIALDGIEHKEGPFTAPVFAALEQLDRMIGELTAAALANDPASIVAIVSDHGFIATHTAVNLRSSFVDAGLIELKEPREPFAAPVIASWEAQLWSGGAVAAVVLRDAGDSKVRARVVKLLEEMKSNPANGIARVFTRPELVAQGGYPEAEFLIEFAPGFYMGNALRGDLLTVAGSKGTHGYMPDRPEMHAAFFVKGKGVAQARDLGVIDMRQIAPTLAEILRVKLPDAREPALPIDASMKQDR